MVELVYYLMFSTLLLRSHCYDHKTFSHGACLMGSFSKECGINSSCSVSRPSANKPHLTLPVLPGALVDCLSWNSNLSVLFLIKAIGLKLLLTFKM